MEFQDLLPQPVAAAIELLFQGDDPDKMNEGHNQLKALADGGDMFAAACLGYAFQFEHFDFYDLDVCKEYLQKSADAGNPLGQYYLGMMLYMGEKPFEIDKILGNFYLNQAEAAGVDDARKLRDNLHREISPEEAKKMVRKAKLVLFWEKIKESFRRIE